MGTGALPQIIACQHSSLRHPQMRAEEVNMIKKCLFALQASQRAFKIYSAKVKKYSEVRLIKMWNSCSKIFRLKKRGITGLVIGAQFKSLHRQRYGGHHHLERYYQY